MIPDAFSMSSVILINFFDIPVCSKLSCTLFIGLIKPVATDSFKFNLRYIKLRFCFLRGRFVDKRLTARVFLRGGIPGVKAGDVAAEDITKLINSSQF